MKRIFLIRHGESLANVDHDTYRNVADHAVPLTDKGVEEAIDAGTFLNRWMDKNVSSQHRRRIRVWTSPYERTRRTAMHIANECGSWIKDTKEHILLCEQQFGLFDGLTKIEKAEEYPAEEAHYNKCADQKGRFWARMPLGESRFDVATRIHQSFATFHRDCERKDIDTIIVVGHGCSLRAFTMMWAGLPFEWMDAEPNPNNCSIRLLRKDSDNGYIYPGTIKEN